MPNDKEGTAIRASFAFGSCHTFNTILVRKGYTAEQWADFIPNMNNRTLNPHFAPELLTGLSKSLAKYFGPDSPYFGDDATPPTPQQVKHVDISDAALKATITEYKLPTGRAMPHSITIDAKGIAWFSEYDRPSNNLGMFDPSTEKFREFPMPIPESMPHTGAIGKDGRFWVALAGRDIEAKLAVLDPETMQIKTFAWPEKKSVAGHTLRLDPSGNTIWFSGGDNDHLWSFDIETSKFEAHKFAVPAKYPEDSIAMDEIAVGGHTSPVQAGSYDVAVDSKGKVWASQLSLGTLFFSLDPRHRPDKRIQAGKYTQHAGNHGGFRRQRLVQQLSRTQDRKTRSENPNDQGMAAPHSKRDSLRVRPGSQNRIHLVCGYVRK